MVNERQIKRNVRSIYNEAQRSINSNTPSDEVSTAYRHSIFEATLELINEDSSSTHEMYLQYGVNAYNEFVFYRITSLVSAAIGIWTMTQGGLGNIGFGLTLCGLAAYAWILGTDRRDISVVSNTIAECIQNNTRTHRNYSNSEEDSLN
jgi:hypothetical protein